MKRPVIDMLNRTVTIDGFIVMSVCGARGNYYWNSNIWMRQGRKYFPTPEQAMKAGIKALGLNP